MFASRGGHICHWHDGVKKSLLCLLCLYGGSMNSVLRTCFTLPSSNQETLICFFLLSSSSLSLLRSFFRLLSGFGLTEEGKQRILTNKLKYVQLPVVEQETCSNSITMVRRRRNNVPSLTDNMFCAGVPEGGKDSCQGDSGGPFAMADDNGRFWAAGIVSWGVDCGRQGTYGVYTTVANYLDWITKTMQEN